MPSGFAFEYHALEEVFRDIAGHISGLGIIRQLEDIMPYS